jgi:hypothetical protein
MQLTNYNLTKIKSLQMTKILTLDRIALQLKARKESALRDMLLIVEGQ